MEVDSLELGWAGEFCQNAAVTVAGWSKCIFQDLTVDLLESDFQGHKFELGVLCTEWSRGINLPCTSTMYHMDSFKKGNLSAESHII